MMSQKERIADKWRERSQDLSQFCTLIQSRSNIFLHGPNGSGKTTFVQDCFTHESDNVICLYVDSIEFYSEKLMAIRVSHLLNCQIQARVEHAKKAKVLNRTQAKSFVFKPAKSWSTFVENLQQFTDFLQLPGTPQLACFQEFHFYICLDNVKAIFKVERQKRGLEKLAIAQSLIQPSCFNILVLNDGPVDSEAVFGVNTDVFHEYMFCPYYFQVMPKHMLQRLISEAVHRYYVNGHATNSREVYLQKIVSEFHQEIFQTLFDLVYQNLSQFTSSANEFFYFCKHLYPEYLKPALDSLETSNSVNNQQLVVQENDQQKWERVQEIIHKRGQTLYTSNFKILVRRMMRQLYVHSSTIAEIQKEYLMEKDKKDNEEIRKKIDQDFAMQGQKRDQNTSKSNGLYQPKITYLEDYQKEVHFSYFQSLALIAAYVAGNNKESTDLQMFMFDRMTSKAKHMRSQNDKMQKDKENNAQNQQLMLGKFKRFSLERYMAILDFFVNLTCQESMEVSNAGHSLDYIAVLNGLVEEKLLQKEIQKRNGSTMEDLNAVTIKCNFDYSKVVDVAKKIDFPIDEYLINENKEQ